MLSIAESLDPNHGCNAQINILKSIGLAVFMSVSIQSIVHIRHEYYP